jgi:pyruvate dehydrogenase E1 component
LLNESTAKHKNRVQLLGSGTILREVEAAAKILEQEYKVTADVWSVTSFNELRRDGLSVQRWNLMHPDSKPKTTYVEECLANHAGPVIAATDYLRIFADQVREWIPRRYYTLGTDGFGRSDTRQRLRYFHEMDRHFIVIAALKALADEGEISLKLVKEAMDKFGIRSDKPDPVTV